MTMREKAARGLVAHFEPNTKWDKLPAHNKANAEDIVRVALAALRDPENPALLAAFDGVGIDQDPRDYWRAGIDAILEEKPE